MLELVYCGCALTSRLIGYGAMDGLVGEVNKLALVIRAQLTAFVLMALSFAFLLLNLFWTVFEFGFDIATYCLYAGVWQ